MSGQADDRRRGRRLGFATFCGSCASLYVPRSNALAPVIEPLAVVLAFVCATGRAVGFSALERLIGSRNQASATARFRSVTAVTSSSARAASVTDGDDHGPAGPSPIDHMSARKSGAITPMAATELVWTANTILASSISLAQRLWRHQKVSSLLTVLRSASSPART